MASRPRPAAEPLLVRTLPLLRRPLGLLEAAPLRLDAATEEVFDGLYEAAADGGRIDYALPQPKHLFLRHVVGTKGVLLHGSNRLGIDAFLPRRQTDYFGRWTSGVFATSDGVWPLFFAVVSRAASRSLWNACLPRPGGRSLYFFSISGDPADARSWCDGAVYLLPRAPFRQVGSSPEWVTPEAVRPLAWLPVAADEFPFRRAVFRHVPGDSRLRLYARLVRARPPQPRVV